MRIDVGTVGYAWTRTYDVLPAEPIRALLSPIPISLEGLDVFGSGRAGDPMSLSRDAFVIDTVLLRSLPTIPETDVLRATEVAPSASAASDYTSVPFIRGGTSDGTPTLLDGMRLFNAFHLGGLVSAINADVVKRVTVLPGSGGDGLATGSLSGAFDIATRDGSRDRRRTSGSLGLVSSRFSVEGPVGENVSYLIGGRRTWLDGLTKGLTKIGVMKESFPYSFRDVVAKVATDLGGVRRLSVSAYLNSESMSAYLNSESGIIAESTAIRDSTETALTWGNAGFSVHYRDRFGVQGIVDANLGYSRFRGDVFHRWERPLLEDGPNDTLSGAGSMSETRLGLRLTWHAAGATITTGTQATRFLGRHDYHVAEPLRRAGRGGMLSDFLTPLALRGSQWRLAAYSRVEVPLRRGVSTRGGVRVDRFADLATTLAPFAELAYTGSWWEVRIAGSRSYQALASLRNEEVLLASVLAYDLLVPVREGPIPHNTEFSIGWQGGRRGLRVRVDAYTRHLDHLRLPDLGTQPDTGKVLVDPSLWVLASGAAHGIETSWSWIWDRGMSVLGSYRWAASSRTVGSRTYTPRFHRDHEFELGWSYRHGASSWSARVSLRSGQPHTPWLAVVPAPLYRKGHTGVVLVKGEYNSARLPHYARFDVGWRRESRVSWFGGGSVVGYLSVVNVFRRSNVVGPLPRQWEVLRVSPEPTADKVYRQQLPIIPFLGVEFRF